MNKIAIPIASGDLCDDFKDYQYFLIYDSENSTCIREDLRYPPECELEMLTEWFIANGISDIIVRGIDHDSVKKLNHNKIHVFVGVRKKNPKDLIMDYINKILDTDEQMCY